MHHKIVATLLAAAQQPRSPFGNSFYFTGKECEIGLLILAFAVVFGVLGLRARSS